MKEELNSKYVLTTNRSREKSPYEKIDSPCIGTPRDQVESSDVSKNLSSVVIGAGVRVREVKPAKFLSEDAVPTSFKMTNSSYTALPLRER